MAGDWLKVEISTPDKPEVFEIANELDIDPDEVVGKLFRVWSWFDQHTEEGNAPVTLTALLNRQCGNADICGAMHKAGWLIIEGDRMTLPNFDRHNGQTSKCRALTAKRVKKFKEKSNAKGNAKGNANGNGGSVTREEKRREE